MLAGGTQIARGHLRLAHAAPRSRGRGARFALLARAVLIRLAVFVGNLVALAGAAAALLPLVLRGGPLGRRHVPRAAPRVVTLVPRRRAGSPS